MPSLILYSTLILSNIDPFFAEAYILIFLDIYILGLVRYLEGIFRNVLYDKGMLIG